jgi:uncharacterized protein
VRIVFDTNVLLAAFASRGLCDALFAACLPQHEIVLSEHILAELRRHLVSKIRMTEVAANEIVVYLRASTLVVKPGPVSTSACPDQDDLPVLGTALAASAALLVTGDKELLQLRKWEGTRIVSPRTLYDELTGQGD